MNFIINATDEVATRADYIVSNESRQMKRLPAGCPIVKFNDRERMRGIDYEINRSIAFPSPLFASIPIIQISIFFFYTLNWEKSRDAKNFTSRFDHRSRHFFPSPFSKISRNERNPIISL